VFYALHGPEGGQPLLITLPMMASFEEIFGSEMAPVLQGYLDQLTDRYRVLLVDYPSIGGSRDILLGLFVGRQCWSAIGLPNR
jgi:hypothetical protein